MTTSPKRVSLAAVLLCALCACSFAADTAPEVRWGLEEGRWSAEKANQWYAGHRWMAGANFAPSTASNQLEMWQAETWDPATIDRELGWAAGLGFNVMRVYLHDMVWAADPAGFERRIDEYLALARRRDPAATHAEESLQRRRSDLQHRRRGGRRRLGRLRLRRLDAA